MNATVSPDGRWLAYTSDVSGSFEVYLRQLTDGRVGPATRVTTGGAVQPCWSRDGRRLFYVGIAAGMLSARMMSVMVVGTVVGASKGTVATTILNWPKATMR